MSVVLAIKQDNKIYLGADSQVTRGGTRLSLSNPNNYKIWKVKGVENCIIGSVGVLRDACVIRIMDNLIRQNEITDETISFEYVVDRIVPRMKRELEEYGYLSKNEKFDGFDSSFLIAHKDKLYYIGSDAAVIEIDDCIAIGTGSNESLGSLLSTNNEDPLKRIIKAVKSSATHDIYVDYPIIITDTESTEFSIINK